MRRLFFLVFCMVGCGQGEVSFSKEEKPLLLVSIAPYRLFVERIAGPEFRVQTIVPQGDSAHTYEPTARQVAQMSQGHVWFRIGEPFEGKILPFLKEHNPGLVVQDLREGLELLHSVESSCCHVGHDHEDRHIWMSPMLAAKQVKEMAHLLGETFPESKEKFQSNADALCLELAALDREIGAQLAGVDHRVILVSHPAFGYFCHDYQCEQLSVEYEGKEPRPQYLEQLLHRAVNEQVSLAIALPQYNNKGAQRIAEELHLPVQMLDPYSPDYFETMRRLASWIADPLPPS